MRRAAGAFAAHALNAVKRIGWSRRGETGPGRQRETDREVLCSLMRGGEGPRLLPLSHGLHARPLPHRLGLSREPALVSAERAVLEGLLELRGPEHGLGEALPSRLVGLALPPGALGGLGALRGRERFICRGWQSAGAR